jgi:hypothetical protein
VGGCRFAANVVVLPHGFYYGQVPGDGAELVAAHGHGRVALPWLRGRAGLPAAVAAAQHAARTRLGLLGVDDLRPLRSRPLTPPGSEVERFEVVLAGPAGDVAVTVENRPGAEAGRLTCRAVHPAHPRAWHLLSLET